jgi:hypothetical protein
MDEKLLIELLERLSGPQEKNALTERCLKPSGSELKEFLDELSQLLRDSPDNYLPRLQTFITHLREYFSTARRRNLRNAAQGLANFVSMLITVVIIKNLLYSDIPNFGELIYDCVELLWQCRDDKPSSSTGNKINGQIKSTTKRLFTEILKTEGAFGVLISEAPGRLCIKRVLFNFNMINDIEQKDLLKAVDIVASLLEKCFDHENAMPKLTVHKACNALSETLINYKSSLNARKNSSQLPDLLEMVKLDEGPNNNEFNNNNSNSNSNKNNRKKSISSSNESTPLSVQDQLHLTLLNMESPRNADLPNFLRDLEQRKIDSFKVSVTVFFFFITNPNHNEFF